jgi:hypothetical protein
MGRLRRIALACLVVGGVLLVSSSGALQSLTAERTTSLGIAGPDNGMVEVRYPNANSNGVIELDRSQAAFCFFGRCYYFGTVARLTNRSTYELNATLSATLKGPDIGGVMAVSDGTPDPWTVDGRWVNCPYDGSEQQAANGLVDIEFGATAEDTPVRQAFDREVPVKCVAG